MLKVLHIFGEKLLLDCCVAWFKKRKNMGCTFKGIYRTWMILVLWVRHGWPFYWARFAVWVPFCTFAVLLYIAFLCISILLYFCNFWALNFCLFRPPGFISAAVTKALTPLLCIWYQVCSMCNVQYNAQCTICINIRTQIRNTANTILEMIS